MVSIYKTLGKFLCLVFQYNVCWKNLWKFLGVFLLVHYFQNEIKWMPLTRGYIVLNRLVQFNVIRRYVKTNSSPYYS